MVKLVDRLIDVWWKTPEFTAEFTVQSISASPDEYDNHRMGAHAWWQDIEVFVQERTSRRRNALLSFRFNHGGYKRIADWQDRDDKINLPMRAKKIIDGNFASLSLKDGLTSWSARLRKSLPKEVKELRAQPESDIFVYCPGLWGLNDWMEKTDNERAVARQMIQQTIKIVKNASAERLIWVTTGRTDGKTRGFTPGIVDQRNWALEVIDRTGKEKNDEEGLQAKAKAHRLLLLDWWAVGDLTPETVSVPGGASEAQGPVLADFSGGGFHVEEGARDALLGLIFNEVCAEQM